MVDTRIEQQPGGSPASGTDRNMGIDMTASQILEITGGQIDWERIRKLEDDHKPRLIVIRFNDTSKMFGIVLDSVAEQVRVLQRGALKEYDGEVEGFIDFAVEGIGWDVIEGRIPIQVARYSLKNAMKIWTKPGRDTVFWHSVGSIFDDIRVANVSLLKHTEAKK